MFDAGPRPCRRCGKALAPDDFRFERAMLLLGRPYCAGCLQDFTRVCTHCRQPLRRADFESGRAVCLGEDLYCDGCLEEALRTARRAAVLHPSVKERLEHPEAEAPALPASARPEGRGAAAAAPAGEGRSWESRRATVRFVPP